MTHVYGAIVVHRGGFRNGKEEYVFYDHSVVVSQPRVISDLLICLHARDPSINYECVRQHVGKEVEQVVSDTLILEHLVVELIYAAFCVQVTTLIGC